MGKGQGGGRVRQASRDQIIEALSAIHEAKYYEDVNLIGHVLWGWKLADLRGVKEKMLMHFSKTQKVFKFLNPGRTSALGTQFRLYAHLLAVGHKCQFEDFKIPESEASLKKHIQLWNIMCSLSGDKELIGMEDVNPYKK